MIQNEEKEFFKEYLRDGMCEDISLIADVQAFHKDFMRSHITFNFLYCDEVIGEVTIWLKRGRRTERELAYFFDSLSQFDIEMYCEVLAQSEEHMEILKKKDFAFIYDFKVSEEYRNLGVGIKLLDEIGNFMKMAGFKAIYVNSYGSDKELLPHTFFAKNGYKPIRMEDFETEECSMYKFL